MEAWRGESRLKGGEYEIGSKKRSAVINGL
jgi:hypothetical protein